MLSRQCELVHRRYTADQETVLTAAPLGLQGSRRFGAGFPKTPPHQAGLYGENSSRVRVGERERRPGWHLSSTLHREAVQHWYNRPPRKG